MDWLSIHEGVRSTDDGLGNLGKGHLQGMFELVHYKETFQRKVSTTEVINPSLTYPYTFSVLNSTPLSSSFSILGVAVPLSYPTPPQFGGLAFDLDPEVEADAEPEYEPEASVPFPGDSIPYPAKPRYECISECPLTGDRRGAGVEFCCT
jgi:hypothetical protein